MSSLIQAPPAQIAIGGGGPPGAAPQAGPQDDSAPDMAAVRQHLKAAAQELQAAQQSEGDDADGAQIAQLIAKVHTLIAGHQQLTDQAMGAGPGVKLVRKAGGNGAPGYAG